MVTDGNFTVQLSNVVTPFKPPRFERTKSEIIAQNTATFLIRAEKMSKWHRRCKFQVQTIKVENITTKPNE